MTPLHSLFTIDLSIFIARISHFAVPSVFESLRGDLHENLSGSIITTKKVAGCNFYFSVQFHSSTKFQLKIAVSIIIKPWNTLVCMCVCVCVCVCVCWEPSTSSCQGKHCSRLFLWQEKWSLNREANQIGYSGKAVSGPAGHTRLLGIVGWVSVGWLGISLGWLDRQIDRRAWTQIWTSGFLYNQNNQKFRISKSSVKNGESWAEIERKGWGPYNPSV